MPARGHHSPRRSPSSGWRAVTSLPAPRTASVPGSVSSPPTSRRPDLPLRARSCRCACGCRVRPRLGDRLAQRQCAPIMRSTSVERGYDLVREPGARPASSPWVCGHGDLVSTVRSLGLLSLLRNRARWEGRRPASARRGSEARCAARQTYFPTTLRSGRKRAHGARCDARRGARTTFEAAPGSSFEKVRGRIPALVVSMAGACDLVTRN